MAFDGVQAAYVMDVADALAGMDRVERKALQHAGRMERTFHQAGHSFDKMFFGAGRVAQAGMIGFGASMAIVNRAIKEYNNEYPGLAFNSRTIAALKREWQDMVPWIVEGARAVDEFAASMVETTRRGRDSSFFKTMMGIARYHGLVPWQAEDEATKKAMAEQLELERERQRREAFGRLRGELIEAGARVGGETYDSFAYQSEKDRKKRLAEINAAAQNETIDSTQKDMLIAEVERLAEMEMDAYARRLAEGATAAWDKFSRDQDEILRQERGRASTFLREVDEINADTERLRIQTMKNQGLNREAELTQAILETESRRLQILRDETIPIERRRELAAEYAAAASDMLASISLKPPDERLSTRTLASGRASREVSRLVFGTGAATTGTGRDTQLAETRKQTRLLEEIRDRVGPAVLGE